MLLNKLLINTDSNTQKNNEGKYPYLSDCKSPKNDVSKLITGINEIRKQMKIKLMIFIGLIFEFLKYK